jgi:DNA transposition AAA+ family ATPase
MLSPPVAHHDIEALHESVAKSSTEIEKLKERKANKSTIKKEMERLVELKKTLQVRCLVAMATVMPML